MFLGSGPLAFPWGLLWLTHGWGLQSGPFSRTCSAERASIVCGFPSPWKKQGSNSSMWWVSVRNYCIPFQFNWMILNQSGFARVFLGGPITLYLCEVALKGQCLQSRGRQGTQIHPVMGHSTGIHFLVLYIAKEDVLFRTKDLHNSICGWSYFLGTTY